MSRRLPFIPATVAVLVALAVAAVAASAWRSEPRAPSPRLELSGRHLQLTQTLANRALIRLTNAKPGQVASGKTDLRVTGGRAVVMVRPYQMQDVAGPNGGKLIASRYLRIDIRCVQRLCPGPPVVYRGPLSVMGVQSLGTFRPGTSYRYLVRVWLPRGRMPPTNTTGDNLFQGSRAKFGLLWTATGA